MDAAVVVGGIILAVLGVAALAYVTGRATGREILEERALQRALVTKVEAMMSRPIVVAPADTSISRAAAMMVEGGFGSLPVVDDAGRLVGIVTESDLTGTSRRGGVASSGRPGEGVEGFDEPSERGSERPVSEVMNPRVVTARPDEPVSEVAARMVDRNVRHVPVVEGDIPVGMITRHDLLARLVRRRSD